jgi:hypothetical protein
MPALQKIPERARDSDTDRLLANASKSIVSKRYQTRFRNPKERGQKSEIGGQIWLTVKKVRTPRLQGFDLGENAFFDFLFRLQKSCK